MRRIDLSAVLRCLPTRQQGKFGILDILGRRTFGAIEPGIADHAMNSRRGAGRQGRMTDDRFGVRMTVVRIGEYGAPLKQITKSASTKTRSIAIEKIAA